MKRLFYPKTYCVCDACKKISSEFVRFIEDESYFESLKRDGYPLLKTSNEHYLCKKCFGEIIGDFEEAKKDVEITLFTNTNITDIKEGQ